MLGTPQPLSIAGSNASHPAQDNCGGSTAVPTLSRALTVVKVAKPKQDMRYDVPVVGVRTIEAMQRAGATCLALDSGKCLLLDGEKTIVVADAAGIAIVAE